MSRAVIHLVTSSHPPCHEQSSILSRAVIHLVVQLVRRHPPPHGVGHLPATALSPPASPPTAGPHRMHVTRARAALRAAASRAASASVRAAHLARGSPGPAGARKAQRVQRAAGEARRWRRWRRWRPGFAASPAARCRGLDRLARKPGFRLGPGSASGMGASAQRRRWRGSGGIRRDTACGLAAAGSRRVGSGPDAPADPGTYPRSAEASSSPLRCKRAVLPVNRRGSCEFLAPHAGCPRPLFSLTRITAAAGGADAGCAMRTCVPCRTMPPQQQSTWRA